MVSRLRSPLYNIGLFLIRSIGCRYLLTAVVISLSVEEIAKSLFGQHFFSANCVVDLLFAVVWRFKLSTTEVKCFLASAYSKWKALSRCAKLCSDLLPLHNSWKSGCRMNESPNFCQLNWNPEEFFFFGVKCVYVSWKWHFWTFNSMTFNTEREVQNIQVFSMKSWISHV